MTWERVHTVNNYYDGPRLGAADLGGRPHLYESIFDEAADEYSDLFWVMPIDESRFSLVMEAWAIWLRWQAAFRSGNASSDTHPALPEDRQRRDELKEAIGPLECDPATSQLKSARFRGSRSDLEVEWVEPSPSARLTLSLPDPLPADGSIQRS
jgi:hypothetical protein